MLSDEKQRAMYDQYGHAGVDPNFQTSGVDGNPFGPGFEGFNFHSAGDGSFHFSSNSTQGGQELDPEELFDMFFGGNGGRGRKKRQRGPRRGADLQMHVRLSFREAVFGTKKDLHVRYESMDQDSGRVELKERDVVVDIPAGIDNGMNLRLAGKGAEGDPGAPAGNLLVQVIVDQDDYFTRDGNDIHTVAEISVIQAILGGTVDIRTLNGEVEVKIPKGCQPEAKLMLRSKGIQNMDGRGKGNHIVHLKLIIPKSISPRQEELLREFDDETATHGLGISGRIAHAAEAAFSKMFGRNSTNDEKNNSKSSKTTQTKRENSEEEKKDENDSDDEKKVGTQ